MMRYRHHLPLLKGDLPQENRVYTSLSTSKYVFKCSAASSFSTHPHRVLWCAGVQSGSQWRPKDALLGCCPFFWRAADRLWWWGERQRAAHPESCKVLVQEKVSVKGRLRGGWCHPLPPPPAHTLPPALFQRQPHQCKNPLPPCLLPLSPLCFPLPSLSPRTAYKNLSGPAPLLQYLNTSPGP